MTNLFLGANWKMNPPPAGSLSDGSPYFSDGDPEIVVFPTFIDLQNCIRSRQLIVGAQCGRAEPGGAFTGDVSMKMLKEFGCSYVLCGHSEHRRYHHETDEEVGKQFITAIDVGLIPILCIGETAQERENGKTEEKLQRQLDTVLKNSQFSILNSQCILAYEPVWAISGGDPNKPAASTAEAQAIHVFIRSILPKELQATRIIYGGSMKGSNAAELLSQPDIDGGLVGGASLKPEEFMKIVEAAKKCKVTGH